MFQGSEIFVILLVALVVLGPERLPVVARKLGGYTAELRKAARELRAGLESELGDVSGLVDEVRSPLDEMKKIAKDTSGEIRQFGSEASRQASAAKDEISGSTTWIGPKPVSGPTPADAMADLESIERSGKPVEDVKDDISEATSWIGPRPIASPAPENASADSERRDQPDRPVDGTHELNDGPDKAAG